MVFCCCFFVAKINGKLGKPCPLLTLGLSKEDLKGWLSEVQGEVRLQQIEQKNISYLNRRSMVLQTGKNAKQEFPQFC